MSIVEPVLYPDGRVRYEAGGVGYTGDTYPDNGANGVNISTGSVAGSPSMTAGGVRPDGEITPDRVNSAISNTSTTLTAIFPEPNLFGISSPVSLISSGVSSGIRGHKGATSGVTGINTVSVTGAVGIFGVINTSFPAIGVLSGIPALSGVVSTSSDSTGSVTGSEGNLGGFDSSIGSQGIVVGAVGYSGFISESSSVTGVVSGSVGYAGNVAGASSVSGTADGTAQEITITEQAPGQQPPNRKPGGYIWSFSGDAVPIRNPTGMVSALSAAIGIASGSQGFAGGTSGGTSTVAGSLTGRRRIREEDDMEVLELLELV